MKKVTSFFCTESVTSRTIFHVRGFRFVTDERTASTFEPDISLRLSDVVYRDSGKVSLLILRVRCRQRRKEAGESASPPAWEV